MLEVERLSVCFGDAPAVRDASFSIAPGARLGIVGESGCGKSVLASALTGLAPEAATITGSIRLAGRELANAPERQWRRHRGRDVAMIFQEPMSALNPLRRIGRTIAEPMMLHEGIGRKAAEARAFDLLDEVGIADPRARLGQFPHEISGGQRQRVLIALALAVGPSLLIADEPTTALDARTARRVVDLLVGLSERRRMALLFISHDLGAVARATERIMVMYGGDVVEQGVTEKTLAAPRHPYTAGLLAARPAMDRPTAGRRRLPTIPGWVPPLGQRPAGCPFSGRCGVEMAPCAVRRPEPTFGADGSVAACHRLAADEPLPGEHARRQEVVR